MRAGKAAGLDGSRWGRKMVVTGGSSVRAWYAREDLHGGDPVVFAPAVEINAALEIGAAVILECSVCGHKQVHRSDDYQCIDCRHDPWLCWPERYPRDLNEH